MTNRKLLLLKWLMIVLPPAIVAAGHGLLTTRSDLPGHTLEGLGITLLGSLVITGIAFVIAFLFVERLFEVLNSVQGEAIAREQDVVTMNAILVERERLGRELHDGAAQLVAQMLLRLDMIKDLLQEDRKLEAGNEMEALRRIGDEMYLDIGESITGIRTDVTVRGLIATLRDYADQFDERNRIEVILQLDDALRSLPHLTAFQIFRLVQESLTNVRKHAHARRVTVAIACQDLTGLRIDIVDDGQGFERKAIGMTYSLGMTIMRERVEALGGTFRVQSEPGRGTRIIAVIPVPAR